MASIISAGTSTGTALNLTGDTSGVLSLASNNGTVGLTIDASQNVGIGTASPNYKLAVAGGRLQVNSNSEAYSIYMGYNSATAGVWMGSPSANVQAFYNNAGDERMRITSSGGVCVGTTSNSFYYAGTNATSSVMTIQGNYDNLNLLGYSTNPGLDFSQLNSASNAFRFAAIQGIMTNTTAGSEAGALGFFTQSASANVSERMRIDSSGNLLVGCTSRFSTIVQGVQAQAAGSASLALSRTADNGAVARFFSTSTEVGNISVTGSTTTFNSTSDYRLKENVLPMTGALDKVAQLKPVTYVWKNTGDLGQGFIAHELQAVVPDCVTGEKDAVDAEGNPIYQGIDTSFLVATLTAAIQEQQALITQLQADVAALKGAK